MTNKNDPVSLPNLDIPVEVETDKKTPSAVIDDIPQDEESLLDSIYEDAQEVGDYDEPLPVDEVIDIIDETRNETDGDTGISEVSSSDDTSMDTSDDENTVIIDAVSDNKSTPESEKGSKLKQTMASSRMAARKAEKHAKAVRTVSTIAAGALLLGAAGAGGYWGLNKYRNSISHVPTATAKIRVTDNSLDPCQDFKSKGLKCKVSWKVANGTKRGDLISQSIKAGTDVRKGSGISLTYSNGPEKATMPNVVGMDLDDAKQAIYEVGVDVSEVTIIEKPGVSENTVTSSSIEAGAEVANGNGVNLEVANGKVGIPNWTGKTKDFVETDAKKHGIKVKFIEEDSNQPPGSVLSQSPKPTESASTNEVQVTVAKAPSASDVSIPDVVGKSAQDAQSALATAGFRKISTVKVSNCAVTSPQVTQTIPAAGATAKSDTDITVIVSEPDGSCSK